MSPRNTGILFLVASALAAFVFLYEVEGEEGRKEAEAREKRLFSGVEAEDVEWVSLVTNDGVPVRAVRSGDTWQITEPLEFPGDDFALDGIAAALAEVTSEAAYDDPQPPEVYGLDSAQRDVRFSAAGEERVLRRGNAAPMGGASYVRVEGHETVYTVPSVRVANFDKSFGDLREKRILRFDAESVSRLSASWPHGAARVERSDDEWRVTSPVQAAVDEDTVRQLLSNLSFLRATGFEDEPPGDEVTGLDAPEFAVELEIEPAEDGGDMRVLKLEIGAEGDEGRWVRAGHPSLFLIPAERLDDYPRELSAYRFKELAAFAAADADRVEILFQEPDGESISIEARRSEEDGSWAAQPEPMAPEKLASLVTELSQLEAARILAESAGADELEGLQLDPPRVTLRVWGAPEGEESEVLLVELRLGNPVGSDGIPTQRPDDPLVYELSRDLGEFIPVSLEAFRNRFLEEQMSVETEAADPGAPLDMPPDTPLEAE